jgi:hypothetical protein
MATVAHGVVPESFFATRLNEPCTTLRLSLISMINMTMIMQQTPHLSNQDSVHPFVPLLTPLARSIAIAYLYSLHLNLLPPYVTFPLVQSTMHASDTAVKVLVDLTVFQKRMRRIGDMPKNLCRLVAVILPACCTLTAMTRGGNNLSRITYYTPACCCVLVRVPAACN